MYVHPTRVIGAMDTMTKRNPPNILKVLVMGHSVKWTQTRCGVLNDSDIEKIK